MVEQGCGATEYLHGAFLAVPNMQGAHISHTALFYNIIWLLSPEALSNP